MDIIASSSSKKGQASAKKPLARPPRTSTVVQDEQPIEEVVQPVPKTVPTLGPSRYSSITEEPPASLYKNVEDVLSELDFTILEIFGDRTKKLYYVKARARAGQVIYIEVDGGEKYTCNETNKSEVRESDMETRNRDVLFRLSAPFGVACEGTEGVNCIQPNDVEDVFIVFKGVKNPTCYPLVLLSKVLLDNDIGTLIYKATNNLRNAQYEENAKVLNENVVYSAKYSSRISSIAESNRVLYKALATNVAELRKCRANYKAAEQIMNNLENYNLISRNLNIHYDKITMLNSLAEETAQVATEVSNYLARLKEIETYLKKEVKGAGKVYK